MEVLRGAVDGLFGRVQIEDTVSAGEKTTVSENTKYKEDISADITFGYCTEFIINLEKPFGMQEEDELKSFLESIGDSIVCVSDDEIVKIHVHTNHPGQAFEKGLTYGYLSNMKVDNMRLEHHEKVIRQAEREEAARQEEKRQAEKEKACTEETIWIYHCFDGRWIGSIFQRTWRRLCYRRRTDDESKHRGYVKCD